MEYSFRDTEKKWQKRWMESGVYKIPNTSVKPKFYVLDMFPYPSGTGLHVGHPLGYIASDIYARYKRLKGFNVLHPMGYDSFGLPAEQYALETGQHPAITTEKNIKTFRQQLDNIGLSFDWSRELRTSDPKFYKWTQWIFLQIFNSWYDKKQNKARRIEDLVEIFEQTGNTADNGQRQTQKAFSANEWRHFSDEEKQETLMDYRLAFSAYGEVNWCEALGTVLANDEVINGVSERGGHPVVKKKMRQWYLRITDYAERLLEGLETVEFTDAMKEMQRNWIGKSEGAEMEFEVQSSKVKVEGSRLEVEGSKLKVESSEFEVQSSASKIKVYTTRPDTIFGVDFMVLAPEHELVNKITIPEQQEDIEKYLEYVKSRSERERLAEVKSITGAFTGAFAINPFDGREIPIWISEYVLAGYGTGAIMAVPCGDQRDYDFARHFNIPITNIIGEYFNGEEANPTKEATLSNSGFLNGIKMKDAIEIVLEKIEREGRGHRKVNYKMRDAGFSRQRYWGEPFPIVYKNGIAYPVDEKELPVELPHVENYSPGPEGEGPLANIPEWVDITRPPEQNVNLTPSLSLEGNANLTPNPSPEGNANLTRPPEPNANLTPNPSLEGNANLTPNPSPEERGERNSGYITSDSSTWAKLKPLARENRKNQTGAEHLLWVWKRETNTMPGYAGSSWYFLRYMDPHNDEVFADKKAIEYWNQVDVYVGGTEHAVGHLLYSRLWTKILSDLGYISFDEPYKKLVNQGMIQGSSRFVDRLKLINVIINDSTDIFVSYGVASKILNKELAVSYLINKIEEVAPDYIISKDLPASIFGVHFDSLHVDVNFVNGIELDIETFKKWKPEFYNAKFINEDDGKFICRAEVEKMSKSKYNTINPNDLIDKYGADTFRMYEMFLGPVEQSKPWDTKGIEGVHRFLKKLWRLFYDEAKGRIWNEETASEAELKILHKTIKKVEEDTERFSFNTAVSAFMVCVNELTDLTCHKKDIVEPLLILLAPYAPHIAEELFHDLGNDTTIIDAVYPKLETKYLIESEKEYPISINGKLRTTITISLDASQADVEKIALGNEIVKKWLEGRTPKKIIFVKNKMVNVVV